MFALGGAAVAVFSMLLLPTASFAAPAQNPSMIAMAACHEGAADKGSLTCSNDCAVVCHTVVLKAVNLARLPSWTSAAYSVTFDPFSSESVETEDPPPRS